MSVYLEVVEEEEVVTSGELTGEELAASSDLITLQLAGEDGTAGVSGNGQGQLHAANPQEYLTHVLHDHATYLQLGSIEADGEVIIQHSDIGAGDGMVAKQETIGGDHVVQQQQQQQQQGQGHMQAHSQSIQIVTMAETLQSAALMTAPAGGMVALGNAASLIHAVKAELPTTEHLAISAVSGAGTHVTTMDANALLKSLVEGGSPCGTCGACFTSPQQLHAHTSVGGCGGDGGGGGGYQLTAEAVPGSEGGRPIKTEVNDDAEYSQVVVSYICGVCHALYSDEGVLRKHIADTHTSDSPMASTREENDPNSINMCLQMESFAAVVEGKGHAVNHHANRPVISGLSQLAAAAASGILEDKMSQATSPLGAGRKRPSDRSPNVHSQFSCGTCRKVLSSAGGLRAHMRIHTGEKPFECGLCGACFTYGSSLKHHMRRHKGEKPYGCTICHASFTRSQGLAVHRRSHTGERPYQCSTCGAAFREGSSLRDHEKKHSGERPHKCPSCPAAFIRGSTLSRHMRTHTGEKRYCCQMCQAKFTSSDSLKEHMFKHMGVKPYVCKVCGAKFTRGSNLRTHLKVHKRGGAFVCKICPQDFQDVNTLVSHNNLHHVSASNKASAAPVGVAATAAAAASGEIQALAMATVAASNGTLETSTVAGDRAYSCDICFTTFKWVCNYQSHMAAHRNSLLGRRSNIILRVGGLNPALDQPADTVTVMTVPADMNNASGGRRPHTCATCLKSFTHSATLRSHMRIHTGVKPYKCLVCEASFAHSGTLKLHVRSHTGEKPHVCNVCQAKFTRYQGLRLHMRGHTGERPYTCTLCHLGFKDGSSLKDHMRKHSGEKPHKCKVCSAAFIRASTLNRHARIHTGVKPFRCQMCPASFTSGTSLKEHMHKHMGLKPYQCQVCPSRFARTSNLRSHLRVHRKGEVYSCPHCDTLAETMHVLVEHVKNAHSDQ